MKLFLFLSLLVCFTACENPSGTGFRSIGYRSYYYKNFSELCPSDEFEYNGLKVNSFFSILGFQEFIPIGEIYALEDSVNYHRLFNESDADQLEEIKSSYIQRLIEMYGQHYLNDPLYKEPWMYQIFSALQANLTSFRGKGKNPLVADVALGMHSRKMEKAKNFSLVLDTYKKDGPVPGEDVLELLLKMLKDLKRIIGDKNTTMVFPIDETDEIFNKRIYQFDRYVSKSSFKNWSSYFGELYFYMHIPFTQHDSKWVNKSRPCVQAKELPKFYQLKGKVDH